MSFVRMVFRSHEVASRLDEQPSSCSLEFSGAGDRDGQVYRAGLPPAVGLVRTRAEFEPTAVLVG